MFSFVFIVAALVFAGEDQSSRRADRWVGTWSASPQTGFSATDFNNQTLRMVVHTSVGRRSAARSVVECIWKPAARYYRNARGTRSAGAALVVGSDRAVTFSGRSAVTIPPGALAVSDAVNLAVPALSDLAVSIFLSRQCGSRNDPQLARYLLCCAGRCYGVSESPGPYAEVLPVWLFLTGVEVSASEHIDRGHRSVW